MLLLHSEKVICHHDSGNASLYLEANTNSLGERAFWEDCLHLWDHGAAQHPSLGPDEVAVLFDPGHHCEVLREIAGDDAADALLLKLLWSVQY